MKLKPAKIISKISASQNDLKSKILRVDMDVDSYILKV